jgi:hypothetical protein
MFILVVDLIHILHGQLVIKPSESIVLRDEFKSFVASCTGQPNTRVGLYYCSFSIEYSIHLLQLLGDLHYKLIFQKTMQQGELMILLCSFFFHLIILSRVTVERQTYGLRLRIRNLTRTDQGVWECLGSDQDGRPLSRTLQINVKGKYSI